MSGLSYCLSVVIHTLVLYSNPDPVSARIKQQEYALVANFKWNSCQIFTSNCYDLFAVPRSIISNLRLYIHAHVIVYVCLCVFCQCFIINSYKNDQMV